MSHAGKTAINQNAHRCYYGILEAQENGDVIIH